MGKIVKNRFIIIVALFSVALLVPPRLYAQKIARVDITGAVNVKEKTILSAMKLKKGAKYAPEKVKADIESLIGLGSFENVEISFDTMTYVLSVNVFEKPFVKKIEFRGNKRFSKGKLTEEITVKEKEFLDKLSIIESEGKMLTLYKDDGYADCKIETLTSTDEKNRITINFLITEGNKILIEDVVIKGTKVFSDKKIKSLMKTKKKKVYKQETINNDITEIENFYKNKGYHEIAVSKPEIIFNEERTRMTILIIISEGVRFKIGDISFSGNRAFAASELLKQMALKKGRYYNDEKFNDSLNNIRQMYSDKGYLRASVVPDYKKNKTTGVMDIAFNITEGPVFHLGYIDIAGLTYTQEKVIRREIMLKEGDVFRADVLRRSIEKIYNLGFLESVEPEIRPTDKENEVDLLLNIVEGKPGILSAGAGYSSVDQLVGTLQVQHINLLGRAQRLNLMWEFGARKQNYEISWTEPWFLGNPMSFGIDVFNTERLRDYGTIYNAYKELRKGGAVRLGPRLSDILSLLFSYSYEEIEIFNIADSARAAGLSPSKNVTSSIMGQVIRDTRDNIFDATRGSRNSLSLQYAGGLVGGDVNFVKTIGKTSWFFPTFWKFVLTANLQLGWAGAFQPSAELPIYEKFYVGGAETVRGYRYRGEIGPTDGGRVMMVFNTEYKFPIVQEKNRTVLQGAFFYDVGGVWRDLSDINLQTGVEENNLKAGVGFGIRFTTPVFPIRLDWGYGLNHRPNEEVSQFYFTLGQIF